MLYCMKKVSPLNTKTYDQYFMRVFRHCRFMANQLLSLSIYHLLFSRTSLEKPYFSRLFLLKLVISQAPSFPFRLLRAIMSFQISMRFFGDF